MANFVMISMVFAVVLLECAAAQKVHVVGGDMGWIVPTNGGARAYETWAASQQFVVGDILTFNFVTDRHDVQQVPKASFEACTTSNAIGSPITEGPANVTLDSAGDHYYICTVGNHCRSGQKLTISVSANPDACAPTPTTDPTRSPQGPNGNPNSSSPSVLAGVLVPMMAVVMGLFF